MADFEGLIRQALARQDDSDPAARERIYDSSRRAFAKMISSASPQDPTELSRQYESLNRSIDRIEAGYRSAEPEDVQDEEFEAADALEITADDEGIQTTAKDNDAELDPFEPRSIDDNGGFPDPVVLEEPHWSDEERAALAEDDGQATEETFDNSPEYGSRPVYPLRRRRTGTWLAIAATLATLVAMVLGAWWLYDQVIASNIFGNTSQRPVSSQAAADGDAAQEGEAIIVLSATDTGALVTSGRGTADLVTESNQQMIRLVSVRAEGAFANAAKPIGLTLEPGVLKRIAGKKVTVEIRAKSGLPSPATFAVGCEFDGVDVCGRKRFRVGIQVEAIVFSLITDPRIADSKNAMLTLSTDITSTAAQTGTGDPVDIISAQFRLPPN